MRERRQVIDGDNGKCSFDRVAWFYEALAYIYSTGQIAAAKASQVDQMMPGDKVLAVGLAFFWALGVVPLHPIYDYTEHFAELHRQPVDTRYFRLFRVGPISYQSMTAVRAV